MTTKSKFTVSYAGTVIEASSTDELAEAVRGLTESFGNKLPIKPGGDTVYQITKRPDGALRCPDYRVAATPKMKKAGHWPCHLCGRKVIPAGGRMSATPLVQAHLSGPMAYGERGLIIPPMARHQLVRAGLTHLAHAQDMEKPPREVSSPAIDEVCWRLSELEAWKDLVSGPLKNLAADWEDQKNSYAMVRAEGQVRPEPLAKVSSPAQSTKDDKSSVDRLAKIRQYAASKTAEPAAKTTAPAPKIEPDKKPKFVRDQRLMETPGQPVSERAAKFKQSRADLKIPAYVLAEVAGFTIAEYQALESGELSPSPSHEKGFWADMRASLERANRQHNQREMAELPRGEPIKKTTVIDRSTTMF